MAGRDPIASARREIRSAWRFEHVPRRPINSSGGSTGSGITQRGRSPGERARALGFGDEPLEVVEVAECSGDVTCAERADVHCLQSPDEGAHDHEFIMTGGSDRVGGTDNELRLGWIEFAAPHAYGLWRKLG